MNLLLLAAHLNAQEALVARWSTEGVKFQKEQAEARTHVEYIAEASLTIYPATNGNGKAIIACPGGGYRRLAVAHEGHEMAKWFNKQGITYAVLVYRMPEGNPETSLYDVQKAIRILRNNADKLHIKHIGIMGFSAGGHLASTAATHYNAETRPDFQILFYPVITMNPQYTHMGSHDRLLGEQPTTEMEEKYSGELQVTADTPPAFILHSTDDASVPVRNSINYYLSLLDHGVSATLHLYPTGGHGWGNKDSFAYKAQWQDELQQWLKQLKLE